MAERPNAERRSMENTEVSRLDPRKLAVVVALAIAFAVALFFAPQIIIWSFSRYNDLCARPHCDPDIKECDTGQSLENPGCIIGSSPFAVPVIIYGALFLALRRSISWMREA
jgi:hypothetical protein